VRLDLATLAMVVPPLLALEAFFSGSEIALLSADRMRLKAAARTSPGARLALDLANHPERVFSVTLLVGSFCVIGIASLIELYVDKIATSHTDLIAVGITSPIIVFLGELIPKTLFQRYADRLAPWVARPLIAAYYAFFPLTRLLSAYTSHLSRVVAPLEEFITGRKQSTRDQIRSVLSYGKKDTGMKASEKRMIKRIFDFQDSEAKHALIPLVKVDAIEERATVRMALERFSQHRHSRMPVFANRVDNIVGVLEAADLFAAADLDQPVKSYVTPAHYAAETHALGDLMREMRRDDLSMVVIVDEYGGAVGILTFEDIIEEIVGEISDEYDTEGEAVIRPLAEDSWLIPARVELTRANEQLKAELPEGDYETLAGFLLQQFGRIPDVWDELHFTTPSGTWKFTVRRATARSIDMVQVDRLRKAKAEQ
jgi:CBS domain containing-hemolysin-like protein